MGPRAKLPPPPPKTGGWIHQCSGPLAAGAGTREIPPRPAGKRLVWCECGVSVCAGRIPGEVRCDGTVPAAAGWLTGGRPVLGASLGGHRHPRPLAGTLPSSQDTPTAAAAAAGPFYTRVTRRCMSVRGPGAPPAHASARQHVKCQYIARRAELTKHWPRHPLAAITNGLTNELTPREPAPDEM